MSALALKTVFGAIPDAEKHRKELATALRAWTPGMTIDVKDTGIRIASAEDAEQALLQLWNRKDEKKPVCVASVSLRTADLQKLAAALEE